MLFNKKPEDDYAHTLPAASRPDTRPHGPEHARLPKPRVPQTRSVIDPGLMITGTLEGDGELQIDGHIQGDIRCTHLVIGNAASIDGNVAADEIVVRGRVKGAICANRVILTAGAHVESNIYHKKLAIEEGARFEGVACPKDNPIDELRAIAAEAKAAGTAKNQPVGGESATTAAALHVDAGDNKVSDPKSLSTPVKPASGRASKGKAKSAEMESCAATDAAEADAHARSVVDTPVEPPLAKPPARPPTELERLQARLRG